MYSLFQSITKVSVSSANSVSAGSKLSFFFFVQVEFYNLLDTVLAKNNRNTDADIALTVCSFKIYRARNHLLLIVDNRFYNVCSTCSWCIPSRSSKQTCKSCTTYHCVGSNFI